MESAALDDSGTFRVVSNGQLRQGFDPEEVQAAFAKLFKIDIEQARAIVGTKKVLKKGLPMDKAQSYRRKLENIGLVIQIEGVEELQAPALSLVPLNNSAKGNPAPATRDRQPQNSSQPPPMDHSQGLALQPLAGEQASASEQPIATPQPPQSNVFACPKCQLEQEPGEECVGCGIIFSKYRGPQAPAQKVAAATPAATATAAEQNDVRNNDEENGDDIVFSDEEFNLKALGAAVGAAVLGALVWIAIAMVSGFELGLVAWGIGGAIGFAASMFGARGQKAGMACGALALVAILGGKYLVIDIVYSQIENLFSSELMEAGMQEAYDYTLAEAELYDSEVSDDASMRQFMVDNQYSDAYEVENVSAEELEFFKTEMVPQYEYILDNDPSYEEWYNRAMGELDAEMDEMSPWSIMTEDFGGLDLLFLFLGVGTAFQLGSRGRNTAT